MKSSYILHLAYNPLPKVRQWRLKACNNNLCATFLLSYFEYQYRRKLIIDGENKSTNGNSEQDIELQRFSDDISFSVSLQELSDGILNTYSLLKISDGLNLLVSKGFISINSKLNLNHQIDKKNQFRFYPERCNEGFKNEYPQFQKEVTTSDNNMLVHLII